jgi:hypothetical protein
LLKFIKEAFTGLKKGKYHIIYTWILLVCFVAGQYMIYAHQHNVVQIISKTHHFSKNQPKQTVKEKCYLCDVMHHNTMIVTSQVYFNPVKVIGHAFKNFEYNFKSIQLILSCGRAPPSSIYSV